MKATVLRMALSAFCLAIVVGIGIGLGFSGVVALAWLVLEIARS